MFVFSLLGNFIIHDYLVLARVHVHSSSSQDIFILAWLSSFASSLYFRFVLNFGLFKCIMICIICNLFNFFLNLSESPLG